MNEKRHFHTTSNSSGTVINVFVSNTYGFSGTRALVWYKKYELHHGFMKIYGSLHDFCVIFSQSSFVSYYFLVAAREPTLLVDVDEQVSLRPIYEL